MTQDIAIQVTELAARPHEAATARYEEIITFCSNHLRPGVHYGKVPGVPKPFLWQPGAQLVAAAWQVIPRYKILSQTEDFEQNIFSYTVQTRLYIIGSGQTVGAGLGSCNSRETKYLSRKNVADLANTILKIGKKRSYVDAVINTFALSEIFTQDPEAVEGGASEHKRGNWKPRAVPREPYDSDQSDPLRAKFQEASDKAGLSGQQRAALLKNMFTDNGVKTWAGVNSPEIEKRIEHWINSMLPAPAK